MRLTRHLITKDPVDREECSGLGVCLSELAEGDTVQSKSVITCNLWYSYDTEFGFEVGDACNEDN
jgi:hypothetical protein